ncbi:MAG: two-component sensor histidine kinase [Desulfobacterales bacterium]|nr:MAG: two-component sensor histidine kinase [Desulfobacterales bacterium]
MNKATPRPENEYSVKLKWLMFLRVVFSAFLLGSTILLQFGEKPLPLAPRAVLYGLTLLIFSLSAGYWLFVNRIKRELIFAYVQIGLDTFFVTVILFVTGSFSSIFSFLYLVVIIYSSMLLPRRGTMIVAVLCSIQFGCMVDLEYYGFLNPLGPGATPIAAAYTWNQILFKIVITMMACLAVAFLSSLLSEQARKTKKDLRAMEDHVKRVQKMAAVGEMAAGLAHEIKNPLASLAGSIQLLKEDLRYDPDHDRLMQIILREADRLSALVSNFLLYARPPAGKTEAVQLDKVLIETAELFEKDISNGRRIATHKKIHPGIWIAIDPMHLRQILWNLLLNAAEAIAGDGVIDLATYPLRNNEICIRITDNGCGISPETLNSIFDPFFTTKPNGTGLGLSIVHSILEGYGSRLDVESQVSQGTTFTMKFKQLDPPPGAKPFGKMKAVSSS